MSSKLILGHSKQKFLLLWEPQGVKDVRTGVEQRWRVLGTLGLALGRENPNLHRGSDSGLGTKCCLLRAGGLTAHDSSRKGGRWVV